MMMFVLHREYLSIKYYSSSIFSISFLVHYFLIKLLFTLPIIVIYKSGGGLWTKLDFHYEQPDIKFKHDLFMIMNFETTNQFWSSSPDFSSKQQQQQQQTIDSSFIKIPSINSIEYDLNDDNLNDKLNLEINIRSTNENKLKSVRLITVFDFKIKKYAYLELEGLIDAKIDTTTNNNHNHIVLKGTINFKQKTLIDGDGKTIVKDIFKLDKLLNNTDAYLSDYRQFGTYTIDLSNYSYEYKMMIDEQRSSNVTAGNSYKVQMILEYGEQLFRIRPKFWTTIKNAWIQYLAILVIVYYVIFKIKQFIFKEQLLLTEVSLSSNFYGLQKYFLKKTF